MILRNSDIADNILECLPMKSFGEYAKAYGDALTRHYEKNGILVIPFFPIACDVEFLQSITFPKQLKKIGTANGIEQSVIKREGAQLRLNQEHPFVALFPHKEIAMYLQAQVASFNAQLRHALSILFPRYTSMREANITWRLTETFREGMHFDIYNGGRPSSALARQQHRIKIFVNIDSQPRQWHTSLDLAGVLKTCRAQLPAALPADINVINDVIDKLGILKNLPYHAINFPTLSAVIANGETASHEVVYGRRTVGAEFFCDAADMLDPAQHSYTSIARWLDQAGIAVTPDAEGVYEQFKSMKSSYALLQEAEGNMPT